MMKTKDIAFAYKTSVKFRYPNLMCTNEQPLLITGKSGCGKSTLLHITAGLIQNYNGEIWIDNKPIHTFTAKEMDVFRGKHIGIVYQKPHFVASLSIVENIELASFLGSGKRNKTLANKRMEELDIKHIANHLPHEASVGELQRAAIARALMNEPKLIIADEPTSSLDDANASLVAQLLQQQSYEAKAALMIVTHDERLKQQFNNHIQLI